jgi:hypothetical protein
MGNPELEAMIKAAIPAKKQPDQIGITKVIATHFRRNIKLKPPYRVKSPGSKKRCGKRQGANEGGLVDTFWTKALRKEIVLSKNDRLECKAIRLFEALAKEKIKPVVAQFKVSLPTLGIWTTLDGIGYSNDGTVWYIENKTTTSTLADYLVRSNAPCTRLEDMDKTPIIVKNTEFNGHKLQVNAGILALRSHFPVGTVIKGIIVVAAEDKQTATYRIEPRWANPLWFSGVKKVAHVDTVSFSKLPTSVRNRDLILTHVTEMGYTQVDEKFKFGSFVAYRGKSYIVIVLNHMKSTDDPISVTKTRQLELDIDELWKKKKMKISVKGCMLCYTGRGSPYIKRVIKAITIRTATTVSAARKPARKPTTPAVRKPARKPFRKKRGKK